MTPEEEAVIKAADEWLKSADGPVADELCQAVIMLRASRQPKPRWTIGGDGSFVDLDRDGRFSMSAPKEYAKIIVDALNAAENRNK